MAILLALNDFDVLTGEPKGGHHEHGHVKNQKNSHQHNQKESYLNWRESAKVIGVEPKIKFQHLNAEKLPFSTALFDGIFMFDTLQHVQNREIAINECIRVVKPDGVICIIEWNKKTIKRDRKKHKISIDYVDPREYINRDDISVEVLAGDLVNIYILRKI